MRTFEEIIDIIRPFGLWQILVVAETFMIQFLLSLPKYQQNYFLAGKMDYECVRYANATHYIPTGLSSVLWSSPDDEQETFENHCRTYESDSRSSVPCIEWRYSSPYYTSTIVSEWNLVCDRAYLVPTYKSMYLVGYFFGVPVFGLLSDWFGRLTVVALTVPVQVVTFVVTAFSQAFWLAALMRGLQGFVHAGTWKAIFIMNIEQTKPSHRNWICVFIALCFPLSGCVVSLIGMWEGHWRVAHIYSLLPSILAVPLVLLLSESPRWLIMQGKYVQAEKILRRAARFNKTSDRLGSNKLDLEQVRRAHVVEDELMVADSPSSTTLALAPATTLPTENNVVVPGAVVQSVESKSTCVVQQHVAPVSWREHVPNVSALFRSREMRLRTMVLMVQWFVTGMVFYGTSFYSTGQMSGNPFITLLLSCAVRIANAPALALAMQWLGKKKLLTFLYLLSAASLAALALCAEWKMSGLVMTLTVTVAVCFIDGAFETIYAFTGELYPTTLRQSGMGACSMVARIGAVISPFIADLVSVYWQPLPAIIFGTACILATSVLYFLPEMNLKDLPETVYDAEKMRDRKATAKQQPEMTTSADSHGSNNHNMTVFAQNNTSFSNQEQQLDVHNSNDHQIPPIIRSCHLPVPKQCYMQEVSIEDERENTQHSLNQRNGRKHQ